MSITENKNAFVDPASTSIGLSQMFTVTAGSNNPTYLVLTLLDRNEYTKGASGATGTLSGNGHTLNLSSIGGDGRGAGIVFTYQGSSGRYYNSTYGYFDQLNYTSSGSVNDVTNLSVFGTSNLSQATAYATNANSMMQVDPSGYLGSATVVTSPGASGTVPTQATPDSIAATAESFVGKAWNMDGCWVLASTIAAEAGASLPVQSTLIGLPGQANGEWVVAFNGPGGQSANWQSLVHTGEVIVIGTPGGGGHITTCVSGTGSSAMLVDNITYVNGSGQIQNLANDGSSSDVTIAAPHAASQEWAGVLASSVVIYELDTPNVTAMVASDSLACLASQSLASLFVASDPANRGIADWQVYDTALTNSLVMGGTSYADHSAASALTAGSLGSIALRAGATATTDTLEVRAFNGSYWGDWQSLNVAITVSAPPPPPSPPVLTTQTPGQTWIDGKPISLAVAFRDPQGQALTYSAKLSNGQALPSWLVFNASTGTFSGTAPAAAQTLSIVVTAKDTSALTATETFVATVVGAPVLTAQTAAQTWKPGSAIALTLPVNTFTDPQNQSLVYTATLSNGQALPSWLGFNPATRTFTGLTPAGAQTLNVTVTAKDGSSLTASDTFSVTVLGAPVVASQTAAQSWTEGKAISLALPANTFVDPQGQKLTYTATLSSGQALPSWLVFNGSTDTFTGTAPTTAQSLAIKVTATDSSGLAVSESFNASVLPAPVATIPQPAPKPGITVTKPVANQTWTDGQSIALVLPSNTFTDALGLKMTFAAYQTSGPAVTSWLYFNAAADELYGVVPTAAKGVIGLAVIATDAQHVTATDMFSVTLAAPTTHTTNAFTVGSDPLATPAMVLTAVGLHS